MATTPETPTPPSDPVILDLQRMLQFLRGAVLGTLGIAALLFVVVAIYPLLRRESVRENWQYPTWGGLMALACLADRRTYKHTARNGTVSVDGGPVTSSTLHRALPRSPGPPCFLQGRR